MIKPTDTRILVSLPKDLHETLKQEGKADNRSLNNYILNLLINRKKDPSAKGSKTLITSQLYHNLKEEQTMDIQLKVSINAPGLEAALLALAEQLQDFNRSRGVQVTEILTASPAEAPAVIEEPAKAVEVAEVKEEAKPATEEAVTLQDIRALAVSTLEKKRKTKELLNKLGIAKLTDLTEENFTAFYNGLKEA